MAPEGDDGVDPRDCDNPGLAEDQFRMLVTSIRDYAIFMLDPSGHVMTWNAGAEAVKGYLADEIVGKHFSIFYPPEDRAVDKARRLLERALADGRVEDEGWRQRKDGTRFWADVVITTMRDSEGRCIGFAKVTRDLTHRREADEKLRRAEELLAATLYSIGDGLLATDEHACVSIMNPVAARLTGWSEQEALGRPLDEVFHIVNENTRAPAQNPVARVLKEGIVVGLANHTALISRDGVERPIADSGAPIRDAQGVTRGAVLVFRDVTEERRADEALQRSEERLRLMIASVHDYAIYMLDSEGRVATWNSGAERMKGYRGDEIIGAHFSRFFAPEDVAAGKPTQELERAAQDGRLETEAWRVRKDGSRFWANVVVSPIRDASGALLGFAKVTRDLTERRKLEDERIRLAQAEEAVRLRDEFLSIASHELKTPLTALELQLHGLTDRLAGDAQHARKLQKASRAARRLGDLVETLLDVSRIVTGQLKLTLETFDLVEAAMEVTERLRDAAVQAGCVLSLRAPGAVVGTWDRLRVEQIITNLLANAVKYAPGAPVEVNIERHDDDAVIQVSDRGPGVRDDDVSRIFGRFERASSPSPSGMGLGLYIARQVAETHGGSVTVHNLEHGGACFSVRLPVAMPRPATAP